MQTAIQQNNINFKSTPRHKMQLIRRNFFRQTPVGVVFSELNPCDEKDKEALGAIKFIWPRRDLYDLQDLFYNDFVKRPYEQFYAMELDNRNSLEQRIIGLMCLHEEKLIMLRTSPDFAKENKYRKIKGIGEVLLGEAVNILRGNPQRQLRFCSTNDGFYLHVFDDAGMVQNTDYQMFPRKENRTDFTVQSSGLDKLLTCISKKYNIDFTA